ncbi:hypothetical protein ACHAXT_003242 [Thalassiosira profunda]
MSRHRTLFPDIVDAGAGHLNRWTSSGRMPGRNIGRWSTTPATTTSLPTRSGRPTSCASSSSNTGSPFAIPPMPHTKPSCEYVTRYLARRSSRMRTRSQRSCIRRYSVEDLVRMEACARRIQKAFFRRQALKRQREMQQHSRRIEQEQTHIDYCEEGTEHSDYTHEEGYHYDEVSRRRSMLRRINQQGDDYDEEIEVEWRKPSWKFAKRFEAANRPHRSRKRMDQYDWTKVTSGRHCYAGGCGEQLDLWNEGRTSEFSQFGSGITNYFKFLKWCAWVMSILSILHLPVLFINALGTDNKMGMSVSAALTTFGNLGSAEDVGSVDIPGCDETEFQFSHCEIEKNKLARFYAFIDVVGVIIFVLAWLWLRNFEAKESRVLNRSTVSAADYTIRLTSVPADTTEKELAIHFAELTGQAVSAVHLAFNNAREIDMYVQRGKVMQQRYNCVQRIRYEKKMLKQNQGRKKRLRKLMREREDLTILVRQKDEKRGKVIPHRQKAIQAFVTFETEAGFVDAMTQYTLNWFRTYGCCYPERLKFKDTRLKVEQAPEPSTIIWENLEYSSQSRFFRKCLTTSVALLAILFSVLLTFLARDFKGKVLKNASMPCPDRFFDQDPEYQLELVRNNLDLSHCYCSTLSTMEQWNINQCHDHLLTTSQATATSYGAGFIVVFMNVFFTWLMDRAGSFEKHQSLDAMEKSNMVRVFLLKFVNTGCIVLLYGQTWLQRLVRVRFDDATDFNVDWYATGGTSLMIIMLMNVISPHIGSFIAYSRHRSKIRRLEKSLSDNMETNDAHRVWYTQEELNEYYRGPAFKLNYRYSQVLVTLYVCWMYAISMPLMPIFGAVSCYLSYWVDKFLFCNFYRTPPMYSDEMGKRCTSLLGYLVILHMGMSLWMMGCEEIFEGEPLSGQAYPTGVKQGTPSSLGQKLAKKHLFPIEVALVIFTAWLLLSRVSSSFLKKFCGCLRCLTCSKGNKLKSLKNNMNTVQVDYSSARDREIIKGLSSYNILQNPKYQEAFAITPEFAANHNRVTSIRGYNTKEGVALI